MHRLLRSRRLATAFLIIVFAACVGGVVAWRVSSGRLAGTRPSWQPPTPSAPSMTGSGVPPTVGVTPTVVVTPPIPAQTLTPPVISSPTPDAPSPTLASEVGYRFLPSGPVQHAPGGCPGQYILGVVLGADGNPLPEVTLRSRDQWGNEATTTTKSGSSDLGRYDFPLFPPQDTAMTYEVTILGDDGQPISPAVTVPHHRQGPDQDANCHWIDWQATE